jgi:guanylate kinase
MNSIKNSSRLGSIIVVSGPSGTGKSTVCGKVRETMPELGFSVSCTTRGPRPGEVDGKDYHFISKDEFKKRIANGEFIEYAEVFDNYYGTLKREVTERVKQGQDVFLDIDIQGAMQIRECALNDELLAQCCEFIFIVPPSLEVLEQRLRGRASDSEEQISKRLAKSKYEISFWKKYDYLIVNDDLDVAVEEMKSMIRIMRMSTKRMPEDLFNE